MIRKALTNVIGPDHRDPDALMPGSLAAFVADCAWSSVGQGRMSSCRRTLESSISPPGLIQ